MLRYTKILPVWDNRKTNCIVWTATVIRKNFNCSIIDTSTMCKQKYLRFYKWITSWCLICWHISQISCRLLWFPYIRQTYFRVLNHICNSACRYKFYIFYIAYFFRHAQGVSTFVFSALLCASGLPTFRRIYNQVYFKKNHLILSAITMKSNFNSKFLVDNAPERAGKLATLVYVWKIMQHSKFKSYTYRLSY